MQQRAPQGVGGLREDEVVSDRRKDRTWPEVRKMISIRLSCYMIAARREREVSARQCRSFWSAKPGRLLWGEPTDFSFNGMNNVS